MFTLSKLIWLGLILAAIWNFFRFLEKRSILNDKNSSHSEMRANKKNSDNDALEAIYCSRCATFTADQECECADSGIFD